MNLFKLFNQAVKTTVNVKYHFTTKVYECFNQSMKTAIVTQIKDILIYIRFRLECHHSPWSHILSCRIPKSDKLWAENELTLDEILSLIFAKMCIFSTQNLLSTFRATPKSIWSGVTTTFKVILMQLLRQYFFKGVTSLFGSYPSPISHFVIFLVNPLPPRIEEWHTFWMAPKWHVLVPIINP